MEKASPWILAARPKTLTAALAPFFVAASLAHSIHPDLEYWILLLGLGASLCIQIATNYFNDAIDHRRGTDRAERLGPTRAAAAGLLPARHLVIAAWALLLLALFLGIPLMVRGGLPVFFIGSASLACAYLYTGGPLPLAYLGLGEIFVLLFFGIIPVATLVFLLRGEWRPEALLAGMQLGLLCSVLISINNYRDSEQDRETEKKTLSARFGPAFSRNLIDVLLFAPFALNLVWALGRPVAALLPLLLLPLAISISKRVHALAPSRELNAELARSSLLYLGFSVMLSVGLLFT